MATGKKIVKKVKKVKKAGKKKVLKKTAGKKRAKSTGVYDPTANVQDEHTPPADLPPQADSHDEYSHLEEEEEPNEKFMSLGDHLEEFRKRLIIIISIVVVSSIGVGIFIKEIHAFLIVPYQNATPGDFKLILGGVYSPMVIIVKVSIAAAFIFTLPINILVLWGFITPAVSRKVAWLGNLTVGASSFLFWGGILICWFFLIDIALKFMLGTLAGQFVGVDPLMSLEKYYSFLSMLHIGAGLGFQLPLVLVILGALGILTIEWHKKSWKYIVVFTFVFAAFVTPPDPVTQLIMAGALLVLYVVAVLIVWLIERAKRRKYDIEEYH